MFEYILLGSEIIVSVVVVTIALHIRSKVCSESHTFRSMLSHYALNNAVALLGLVQRRKLEALTKDCGKAQEKLLVEILRTNGETEYGKRYKLSEMQNKYEFVANHPLTKYNHYEQYIDQVAKGEQKILTSETPSQLGVTSGTSGRSTQLVFTRSASAAFFMKGLVVALDVMFKAFPKTKSLQRSIKFFYTPRWRTSEGGLKVGPNSSSPSNSKSILLLYCTPKAAYDILTEPELQYIHLLFGLKDRNVGTLESNFASLIYSALASLEANWKQLVDDIEQGRVNPDLEISDAVRSELNKLLFPDKERALELRKEFNQGFDNIARRIWPHLNLILSVTSGSADLYANKLRARYITDTPFFSPLYGATEGLIGLNLWPLESKPLYLMVPEAQFFEFIPVEHSDQDQPQTVFAEDVEAGNIYELVVTTRCGLYRYRIGDVVKVVRFHNQTPVLEFQYRQGQLLNVHMEKTNENDFYQALLATLKQPQWCDAELVDYTCAESVMLDDVKNDVQLSHKHKEKLSGLRMSASFYVVFVEFNRKEFNTESEQPLAEQLDASLRSASPVYESFRQKGSIGQPLVYYLRSGTFEDLRTFLLQLNPAAGNQLKIPRVVRTQETLSFLMKNVL